MRIARSIAQLLPIGAFAGAALVSTAALAERKARTPVLLLGSPSATVERTLRQELGRRGLALVAPGPYDPGQRDTKAQARTVERTTAALEQAKRLFYEARPQQAAELLQRQRSTAGQNLALLRRFDLLREIRFWEGVCRAKSGDPGAARRAFAAAIIVDPRPPDEAHFPPEVIARFDEARQTIASQPRVELELSASPARAEVLVDGSPPTAGRVRLAPGEHWVVATALGYVPVARRLLIEAGKPARLELALLPARRERVVEQLERLRARGDLDATRPAVASALGRVQGASDALIVRERRSAAMIELSLTRLRCLDGQVLGRHDERTAARRVAAAVRRALIELWPAPPPPASPPFYRRWWFWTAVGVAVAGGTVAVIAATTADDTPDRYTFRAVP